MHIFTETIENSASLSFNFQLNKIVMVLQKGDMKVIIYTSIVYLLERVHSIYNILSTTIKMYRNTEIPQAI